MPPLTLAAQVSTQHSLHDTLSVDHVLASLSAAQSILPLSTLIIGPPEIPGLFTALIDWSSEHAIQPYLWYNLLSDYPQQASTESVINWRGQGDINWQPNGSRPVETFQFSCPNNPSARQKTLEGLASLIKAYPFQGVFLDKLRFPSPASGLEMTLSCFCPHCYSSTARIGLDLDDVKSCLQDWKSGESSQTGALIPPGSPWLDVLCRHHPQIQKFLRFRADSITSLVGEVRALTDQHGRKLALDLFSPAFAPFVGQDYPALSAMADWVKPMTYRAALGPAGLRLELISLVHGIERIFHLPQAAILCWAEQNSPGFTIEAYQQATDSLVPLSWMQAEISLAVQSSQPTPVWMGLETVVQPGVVQITPEQVHTMLATGIACGVNGVVLSWDLLHTPEENLRAIRSCLEGDITTHLV